MFYRWRRYSRRSRGFLTRPWSVWIVARCQGPEALEGEAGLAGVTGRRCFGEFGVVLDKRASEGDQSSVSSAGGSQKKKRRQWRTRRSTSRASGTTMDVVAEEWTFIPSAVGSSAGWHEPTSLCDRQCREDGFNYFEIASVTVEDTCELVHDDPLRVLLQSEARPIVNGRQWRRIFAAKRSQGKLATGLGARGFEHKLMEIYAVKKSDAKN